MTTKKPWFREASPELGDAFLDFHTTVTQKSSLDAKTMELIKVAVSSVLRCPHCTDLHIDLAKKEGATAREVADALLVASLQGAGTQLFWNCESFEKRLSGE